MTTVAVNDVNWIYSPYNWNNTGTITTTNGSGAYFRLGFSGTSVSIGLNLGAFATAGVGAADYPIVKYIIDGGTIVSPQLTVGQTAIAISGLVSGNHILELILDATSTGGLDLWNTPVNALVITGATLDTSAVTVAGQKFTKNLIWYGDSISRGSFSNGSLSEPVGNSAYYAHPSMVGLALQTEYGIIGFESQGYEYLGSENVPTFAAAYNLLYAGVTRVFTPVPDYAVIEHGANGAPTSVQVQNAIQNLRTSCGANTRMFVLIPLGGFNRTNITAGLNAYLAANPSDRRTHLIDLGTYWQTGLNVYSATTPTKQAIDGIHPRLAWHGRIAAAIEGEMRNIVGLWSAPRTVSITLVDVNGNGLPNLTGLKWAYYDQTTPDLTHAPSDFGAVATTNALGVISITVNSSQVAGSYGWLVVTNSDGTTTQSPPHSSFSGPVVLS